MKELADYTPQNLTGKIVLVTGGTTGIGRATARILAGLGARVFITGRNQAPLDETIRDTVAIYPKAEIKGITSDLSKEEDINKVFSTLEETFGKIDILVNNAGLAAEGIMKGSYEEWQYVLTTNLLNYMACANAAAKQMQKTGKGHIINVGSMSAETRTGESTVYVATKSGIRGFTASLRKEINPKGIKVTLIEPGLTSSDMQPEPAEEQRKKVEAMEMLNAEDIAAGIIYCLSQPERCNVVSLQVRPIKENI
jgi:NADP-dependent 3-hydroxy acid dehydrogenase YdfG